MKKILKYGMCIVLLGAGTSCTNLDEEIQDEFTQSFVPSNPGLGKIPNKNRATPNDGLGGAFATLLNYWHATSGGYFAVQELGTDEAVITQKGGDWYDGGLYIRMHHHEFSPQTFGINDTWNNAYGGIYQCNDLLGVGGLANGQVAQLKTLRAYLYWILLDVFGNVPIVTTAGVGAAQSTRAQVYAFVEAELLAAIPDLPAGRQEYGRFNQSGAYALLSRLYLNAGVYTGTPQYQKAINAADMVINSGIYSLASNYASVFAPDNCEDRSSDTNGATNEMIFIIPFDYSTGQGSFWSMMTLHYPSQLTYKLTDQPWNGFSTLEDFYNSYEATDKRREANFIVGPQYDLNGVPILDLAFDKADPDGAEINYTPFINELFPNASRQGGARFGKFSFTIGQGANSDNDFPILRYGEVLLNKAEALCRLNNNWANVEAMALVDQIRARAGLGSLSDKTAGGFLAERGRELFVEEHRRTDLIRFGAYGNAWWEFPGESNPNHSIMAIPIEQMQASASTKFPLKQNPGY